MADGWGDSDIDDAIEHEAEQQHHKDAPPEAPQLQPLDGIEARAAAPGQDDAQDDAQDDIEDALAHEAEEAALAAAEREHALQQASSRSGGADATPGSASQRPVCQDCGAISVDNRLLGTFGEAICAECKAEHPGFQTLTKGKAREQFLVTDDDMRSLKFLAAANPRRPGWSTMKLYLVKQVEALSMERWGSAEALEAERESRARERLKRRELRAREAQNKSSRADTASALRRNIDKLRGELGDAERKREPAPASQASSKRRKKGRGGGGGGGGGAGAAAGAGGKEGEADAEAAFVPANERYHEHVFKAAQPVPGREADDLYVKTCGECGFQVQFEKL